MVIQLKMLPFKVFSLAVLVVVVSSQGLGRAGMPGGLGGAGMSGGSGGASMFGGMGGAGMSGGLGGAGMPGGMSGAGMSGGLGGAGMPGGMAAAGMFGGMGEPGMFGGMGMMGSPLMNGDMMDTLSDMYGSRLAMQGFGFGSGLGNFPNPRPQFPMGQFLPQTGAWGGGPGRGRPPTQTFTGIGAIVKTISGIQGGGPPGKPLTGQTGQATNDIAYFPRKNY